MLKVENLETGYDKKLVVDGVSLEVKRGEIVALIGHNGAGKSTILKAIFGLLNVWSGAILFKGEKITNRKPLFNVQDGMSFVPQGNRVFTELSVLENLEMGGYVIKDKHEVERRMERVFELFPTLKERRSQSAGTLSGGEQQMLALGSALMLNPDLLLLDEPSLGLSPKFIKIALNTIEEINKKLNTTILIVEQKVREVLKIAKRVYVLKVGKVTFEGTSGVLLEEDRIREVFL